MNRNQFISLVIFITISLIVTSFIATGDALSYISTTLTGFVIGGICGLFMTSYCEGFDAEDVILYLVINVICMIFAHLSKGTLNNVPAIIFVSTIIGEIYRIFTYYKIR